MNPFNIISRKAFFTNFTFDIFVHYISAIISFHFKNKNDRKKCRNFNIYVRRRKMFLNLPSNTTKNTRPCFYDKFQHFQKFFCDFLKQVRAPLLKINRFLVKTIDLKATRAHKQRPQKLLKTFKIVKKVRSKKTCTDTSIFRANYSRKKQVQYK